MFIPHFLFYICLSVRRFVEGNICRTFAAEPETFNQWQPRTSWAKSGQFDRLKQTKGLHWGSEKIEWFLFFRCRLLKFEGVLPWAQGNSSWNFQDNSEGKRFLICQTWSLCCWFLAVSVYARHNAEFFGEIMRRKVTPPRAAQQTRDGCRSADDNDFQFNLIQILFDEG